MSVSPRHPTPQFRWSTRCGSSQILSNKARLVAPFCGGYVCGSLVLGAAAHFSYFCRGRSVPFRTFSLTSGTSLRTCIQELSRRSCHIVVAWHPRNLPSPDASSALAGIGREGLSLGRLMGTYVKSHQRSGVTLRRETTSQKNKVGNGLGTDSCVRCENYCLESKQLLSRKGIKAR